MVRSVSTRITFISVLTLLCKKNIINILLCPAYNHQNYTKEKLKKLYSFYSTVYVELKHDYQKLNAKATLLGNSDLHGSVSIATNSPFYLENPQMVNFALLALTFQILYDSIVYHFRYMKRWPT